MEPTTILVDNLTSAFQQVTNYLALGLVAAVAALVLEFRATTGRKSSELVAPAGGFPAMLPEVAQCVLLGAFFVVGVIALFTAETAEAVIEQLQAAPDILAAVCIYPSVATAPPGIQIIGAAILPALFVAPIVRGAHMRLKDVNAKTASTAWLVLVFLLIPYISLAIVVVNLECS